MKNDDLNILDKILEINEEKNEEKNIIKKEIKYNDKRIEYNQSIDNDLILLLKKERKTQNYKNILLPEEISLKFNMTFDELKKYLLENKNIDLKKEWKLYREALKLTYSLIDKSKKSELFNTYGLGTDDKYLPNITFIFGKNDTITKSLDIILISNENERKKIENKENKENEKILDDGEFL